MPEQQPLAGKVAWVTGSSRGLGRVFATHLCRLGAAVVVHGTRPDSPKSFDEGESMEQVARDVAAETGATTLPCFGDLTEEAEVERIAEEIRAKLGPVDILVANAGGDIGAGGTGKGRAGKPEGNDSIGMDLADIRAVLDRNLLSCILCCRAVVPDMIAKKDGRVVIIGSIAGSRGSTYGAIYGVAKAGVAHYTRCLADQLRSHNITANCVAPGEIVTPRFVASRDVDQQKMTAQQTLQRYGRPPEVAALIGFLASDEARYISGQVIRVDGAAQTWPA